MQRKNTICNIGPINFKGVLPKRMALPTSISSWVSNENPETNPIIVNSPSSSLLGAAAALQNEAAGYLDVDGTTYLEVDSSTPLTNTPEPPEFEDDQLKCIASSLLQATCQIRSIVSTAPSLINQGLSAEISSATSTSQCTVTSAHQESVVSVVTPDAPSSDPDKTHNLIVRCASLTNKFFEESGQKTELGEVLEKQASEAEEALPCDEGKCQCTKIKCRGCGKVVPKKSNPMDVPSHEQNLNQIINGQIPNMEPLINPSTIVEDEETGVLSQKRNSKEFTFDECFSSSITNLPNDYGSARRRGSKEIVLEARRNSGERRSSINDGNGGLTPAYSPRRRGSKDMEGRRPSITEDVPGLTAAYSPRRRGSREIEYGETQRSPRRRGSRELDARRGSGDRRGSIGEGIANGYASPRRRSSRELTLDGFQIPVMRRGSREIEIIRESGERRPSTESHTRRSSRESIGDSRRGSDERIPIRSGPPSGYVTPRRRGSRENIDIRRNSGESTTSYSANSRRGSQELREINSRDINQMRRESDTCTAPYVKPCCYSTMFSKPRVCGGAPRRTSVDVLYARERRDTMVGIDIKKARRRLSRQHDVSSFELMTVTEGGESASDNESMRGKIPWKPFNKDSHNLRIAQRGCPCSSSRESSTESCQSAPRAPWNSLETNQSSSDYDEACCYVNCINHSTGSSVVIDRRLGKITKGIDIRDFKTVKVEKGMQTEFESNNNEEIKSNNTEYNKEDKNGNTSDEIPKESDNENVNEEQKATLENEISNIEGKENSDNQIDQVKHEKDQVTTNGHCFDNIDDTEEDEIVYEIHETELDANDEDHHDDHPHIIHEHDHPHIIHEPEIQEDYIDETESDNESEYYEEPIRAQKRADSFIDVDQFKDVSTNGWLTEILIIIALFVYLACKALKLVENLVPSRNSEQNKIIPKSRKSRRKERRR